MKEYIFKSTIYKFFKLKDNNTTIIVELIACIMAFIMMAYISFVQFILNISFYNYGKNYYLFS